MQVCVDNQMTENLENQEISANVTVLTSHIPPEVTKPTIGQIVSQDLLLGRWRLSLDLFGRVFMEDVALEPGSIVSELGGFPVKEAKFRRDMEKLRNNQPRDLTLAKVCAESSTTCSCVIEKVIFIADGTRSNSIDTSNV